MTLRQILLACLLAASGSAALADSRVRTLLYRPDTIVQIAGRANLQSVISFAPDERIENVAVGDSSSWQVTPNKRANMLFLKPISAGARTNMTVVTDRRTYLFDLRAGRAAGAALYSLRFAYPPVIAAPNSAQPAPVQTRSPKPLTELNFAWTAKGAKRLRPSRIFDDGKALFLAWPQGATLPAVFAATDDHETPVNYKLEKDYLVVDGAPRQVVLRLGKARAVVTATPTHSLIQTAER